MFVKMSKRNKIHVKIELQKIPQPSQSRRTAGSIHKTRPGADAEVSPSVGLPPGFFYSYFIRVSQSNASLLVRHLCANSLSQRAFDMEKL